MPRLPLVLPCFVFLSSGQQLPTSNAYLQTSLAGVDNEPLQILDEQPFDQADGIVGRVSDEVSIDLILQLANALLAFKSTSLANRNPSKLNRRWQRQSLKMQEDLSSLKVAELKVLLQDKGLPASGKKAELIARLEKHAAQDSGFENLDDLEDLDLRGQDEPAGKYMADDGVGDADVSPNAQKSDLGEMSVAQLEDMLKDKGLKVVGKKAQLIARLDEHMAVEESPALGEIVEDADLTPESQQQDVDGELDDLQEVGMAEEDESMSEVVEAKTQGEHLGDLSVAQLKDMLKENGLRVSGKKAELIARLEEHKAEQEASTSVPPEGSKTMDDADMSPTACEKDLEDLGLEDLDEPVETPNDAGIAPKIQKRDLGDLTVAQLKDMLKDRGLNAAGKKAQLIARLGEHMAVEGSPASGEIVEDADRIPKSQEQDFDGDEILLFVAEQDTDMSASTREKDLGELGIRQLQKMCKEKGLAVRGTKAQLIARLEEDENDYRRGKRILPPRQELTQLQRLDRIIAKRKRFAEQVAVELQISIPLDTQFYTVEVLDLACEKLGISKEIHENAADPQGLIMKKVSNKLFSGQS